jgi:hypothetical protein
LAHIDHKLASRQCTSSRSKGNQTIGTSKIKFQSQNEVLNKVAIYAMLWNSCKVFWKSRVLIEDIAAKRVTPIFGEIDLSYLYIVKSNVYRLEQQ